MKKIITLLALVANIAAASANDYTDSLEVEVNGVATTQEATISLDRQADGSYSFILKNFILESEGQQMGVGTIEVNRVSGVTANGVTTLLARQDITIKEGDGLSPSGIWIGPDMLGIVPVQLVAEQRGDKLYAVIDIDLKSSLDKVIKVTFGNGGYRIGNSDFEAFHQESGIAEPNHWHSFASSKGLLSAFVSKTPHTFVSDVTRPGTSGKSSVMLTSAKIFGIVANGTITTGRMNAGGFTATDPANHAETDLGDTSTDSNGDPFYTMINGVPDSLVVWVKFTQGTPNANHLYATVSATVTDGTYYQEPHDKTYDNIVATAANRTIATNGYQWQRISVPFQRVSTSLDPKAFLVTLSTNADPGQGSIDTLYVDDLSLVYKQDIDVKGIAVMGQELSVADTMTLNTVASTLISEDNITVNTEAAKVVKAIETTAEGIVAHIAVASQDLKTFKLYHIIMRGAVAGIDGPTADNGMTTAVYNLQGQRVDSMTPGKIYIVDRNGKRVKVLRK